MSRQVCRNCGATVIDDDQFCPTCGEFLAHEDEPGNTVEQFELSPVPPPPAVTAARRPGAAIICPSCGTTNSPTNRHCEECGARLSQGPLPAAPRPAVQATAGVRAVVAIAGLLLGVVVIALIFRLFSDDANPTDTTTSATPTSTSLTVQEPDVLNVLDATCSAEAVGSFICENLISSTDTEYQTNWADLQDAGETLTITIQFRQGVRISAILWTNLSDEVRFQQNFKARSLAVLADDSRTPQQFELQNTPGEQSLLFSSLFTNKLIIEVQSAYPAVLAEDNVWTELAIDEIQILGVPATGTAPTDSTTDSTDSTADTSSPSTDSSETSAPDG